MKAFGLLLTAAFCWLCPRAQSPEDSVKTVINQLFAGMTRSDAGMIRSAFADSALLQTVAVKNGIVKIHTMEVADFAKSVAGIAAGDADERISFEMIRIDDKLASVWTPYHFYYKGIFSHCGVNSFQLVRIGGHWKIQYLIDTRRKTGCNPS